MTKLVWYYIKNFKRYTKLSAYNSRLILYMTNLVDLIDSYNKAMADGDIEKAASMLHDDVSWYDGNTNDTKWGGKQSILNNIRWFKNYFDYVSFDHSNGAYPDAIEYKKDGNWVQSWVNVYGVHKNLSLIHI